ncbi:MAG: GNAT family N-acetyltransferase [Pseudomonadales bacterium]|nr:GNAT family N-acetyltransferase [Pseudomonadales bacterium]MDP6472027.1 GNAT family N-acetyltransferase [Pseudomonadales bacterium]MDP6826700.1 GNAT family N-acetyltransferase [Pseudomonadales bacterium]MDP6969939.1 GNAT family N-acetyltransferase [Pseudomonadales bacterium]
MCACRAEFEQVLTDNRQDLLLCENGGRVTGAAWIEQRPHEGRTAIPMAGRFIREICVDEARRSMGLGRTLMNAIEAWAKARGLTRLELNVRAANAGAVRFYDHLGYATTLLEMSKRLDPVT